MKTAVAEVAAFLLLAAGCGKMGDPRPPVIRTPQTIGDLRAAQIIETVVLTWTAPAKFVDDNPATDLGTTHILRDGVRVAEVKSGIPGQPQSYPVDIQNSLNMSMTFTVQVEPIRGRLSGMSNAVSIQPVDIPGPVQNITGVFDQFKIRLDWQPPARNGNLAELYIVKRSDKPERTVKEPNLEDQEYEPGKVYTYTITPARGPGPVIPGPSSEFKLSAVDTKKPAVPAELTIDPNEAGAFLSWRENTERDVAGYYIYRSDRPDTGFARVNVMPHSSHIFAYPAYRPGDYFSVSAVDSSGNESDKSPATRGP